MHPLIAEYLQAEQELELAREKAARACVLANNKAQPTGALRVATAADIVVGALIWYERDGWKPDQKENRYYWKIVDIVHMPPVPYKAYIARSGCFYGLEGAMVEVTC